MPLENIYIGRMLSEYSEVKKKGGGRWGRESVKVMFSTVTEKMALANKEEDSEKARPG